LLQGFLWHGIIDRQWLIVLCREMNQMI